MTLKTQLCFFGDDEKITTLSLKNSDIHKIAVESEVLHGYSEDFKTFASVTGNEAAFKFALEYGVIQISFPKSGCVEANKRAHVDKIIWFFGEEIYERLCREFGGMGRIKIPKCTMLASKIRALTILSDLKKMELKAVRELAKKHGMSQQNIRYMLKKGRKYYKLSKHG